MPTLSGFIVAASERFNVPAHLITPKLSAIFPEGAVTPSAEGLRFSDISTDFYPLLDRLALTPLEKAACTVYYANGIGLPDGEALRRVALAVAFDLAYV